MEILQIIYGELSGPNINWLNLESHAESKKLNFAWFLHVILWFDMACYDISVFHHGISCMLVYGKMSILPVAQWTASRTASGDHTTTGLWHGTSQSISGTAQLITDSLSNHFPWGTMLATITQSSPINSSMHGLAKLILLSFVCLSPITALNLWAHCPLILGPDNINWFNERVKWAHLAFSTPANSEVFPATLCTKMVFYGTV